MSTTECLTSPSQEILAAAPFDHPQADLILLSSDKVRFHVFKIILALTSSVFVDMFSIPSPTFPNPHEVQVVPLSERSEDLDLSLRHLYPMPSLETVPLENVAVLAKFARKYQVDALEKRITQNLKDNMELDPIGVYSIAIAYGYKDVGITAARSCLRLPISCLRSQCEQYVTIQHISELFDYHIACGEAASEIAVSGRTWLSSFLKNGTLARGNSSYNCVSCNSRGVDPDQTPNSRRRDGPLWLWKYIYHSTIILARRPAAEAVTTEDLLLKINGCACVRHTRRYMLDISERFGKEIEIAVHGVPLPDALSPTAAPPPIPDTAFTDVIY